MDARAGTRSAMMGVAIAALLAPDPLHADCPTEGDEPVAVASVEPRQDLRLADGRVLRLVGFDPALDTPNDPGGADTARAKLAALVVGPALSARVLSAKPDRWGRFAALLFAADGAPQPGGIARAAIAAGLGRYRAEPAAHACRDTLLEAERAARAATLGLWADPYYSVLAVEDQAAFAERSGTIIVAEGRLSAVETGPYRTKLRFAAPAGTYGGHVLAATVLPRVTKSFEARGVMFKTLIGRTLRLRGLLDMRFGPQIELDGPSEVELVDPAPTATPASVTAN